jgi:hypothetical protein
MWYNTHIHENRAAPMDIIQLIVFLFAMIFRQRKSSEDEPWGIMDDMILFEDDDW